MSPGPPRTCLVPLQLLKNQDRGFGPPGTLAISNVPEPQNGAGWKGPLEVTSFPQAYPCSKLHELAPQTKAILLGISVGFMILFLIKSSSPLYYLMD